MAFAQTDPGQDLLDQQEQARSQAAAQANASRVEGPARVLVPPVSETPCFPINDIVITGFEELDPATVEDLRQVFLIGCLGQVSIGNLLQSLNNRFTELGYVTTRAYLPPQDIADQVLDVLVVEGRIDQIEYVQIDEDGATVSVRRSKLVTAFDLQSGDVFELKKLERGLAVMNRLPSSSASANLAPGEQPATSTIRIVEQKSDLVRLTVGLDNAGSEETGQTRLRFSFSADDLFDLNETYQLSYTGSENTNAFALSFDVPFRDWRFLVNGSYSESLSAVNDTSDLFSQTYTAGFDLSRLLFDTARSQVTLSLSTNLYENRRFINIVELSPQRRASLGFGIQYSHRFENASLSVDLGYGRGMDWFGADWPNTPESLDEEEQEGEAPEDVEDQMENLVPTEAYQKLDLQVSYNKQFAQYGTLRLFGRAQYSRDVLFSDQQFSVGGWDTVRGYEGFSASGNAGFFLRSEFYPRAVPFFSRASKDVPAFLKGGFVSSFAFVDMGCVRSQPVQTYDRYSSFGAGIVLTFGRATLNATVARPLSSIEGFAADPYQARLDLSIRAF